MILKRLEEQDIGIQLVNITIQDSEPPTQQVMEAFKAVETAKQRKETSLNNANKYRTFWDFISSRYTSGIYRTRRLIPGAGCCKQVLLYDLPSSDVITSDKKTMICDSYILWQITDPLKFAQTALLSPGRSSFLVSKDSSVIP